MVKDELEKKQEEKKEQEEEQKKQSFFDKVPVRWKVAGFAVIAVMFFKIRNDGESLQQIWPYVIGVIIAWWLIGQAGVKKDTGILSPKEARDALKQEIEQMKIDGDIPLMSRIYIGPVSALKYTDGMAVHYEIATTWFEDNLKVDRRAIVIAKGEEKAFVTFQDHVGRVTGREAIPTKFPVPRSWREARDKLGVDLDKVIFGEFKK